MEIRLHGRGGQGGVTCAKILAAAYAKLGKSVQTFGDYAGERSGAPVRAYTRVSDGPINNRNKVYHPDHLVVLDPNLMGPDVIAGLALGGSLLINSAEPIDSLSGSYGSFRLALIDATEIARRHQIGTRTVVIVNTTIAGAFARLHEIPLEALEATYTDLGFSSNFEAAREAYEGVVIREPLVEVPEQPPSPITTPVSGDGVLPLEEHLVSPPTGLKTGSWSAQRPKYLEKLAPCSAFCPAGNDVVGFVQAAHREDEAGAAAILGQTTPLAGVCGRVCPAPCMEGCNRREYDGTVHIRGLERWLSDRHPVAVTEVTQAEKPQTVAIVGSGPAGLSAAYALARAGHQATLFEGEKELGGVLRTGIPVYRLPREVLDREIQGILDLGVGTRCGEFLTTERLVELREEHDALIIATGLQKLRGLEVEGAELAGIEQGIHFLHRVNLEGEVKLSGHVLVLGGGNTAMDCARSAMRAGAERVTVAYRRTRKEMPAIHEEIDEAEHEGIDILLQRAPLSFYGNGKLEGLVLAEVEMGEPDDSGRRRPVVTDRHVRMDCDHVLLALGQSADLSLLPEGWELRGEALFEGDQPLKVFAAGDLATGDGTVTHALGNGRRAAGLALQALGLDEAVFERPERSNSVPAANIRMDAFPKAEPALEVLEPGATRRHSEAEVNHGLPNAQEAHRCFSCGHCTGCDTCMVYCPEGIIERARSGYAVDSDYCKGCGVCVEECCRNAMEMTSL